MAKDRDNKAKSASYFQSQYMQKNEVPETIDGYATHFKPDSVYEKAMDRPEVQEMVKSIREMGLREGISPKAVNAFTDFILKEAVNSHDIDLRTDEEKAADQAKVNAQEMEKLKPYLDNMHRTFEEQHDTIKKFLDAPSAFTNDTELRSMLANIANESAAGFRLVSTLIDHIETSGYKSLPSQSTTVGIASSEFWAKYNAESDPARREAMMQEFERVNGKQPQ